MHERHARPGHRFPVQLDGRWLTRSTGPGWGRGDRSTVNVRSNAVYGNFRYNAPERRNSVGMDEDYDACDLENWFLAIQSADGQVDDPLVPSARDRPLRPQ